jgi:hypothetical protein
MNWLRVLLCALLDHDFEPTLRKHKRLTLEILTCRRCKATSTTYLFPDRRNK